MKNSSACVILLKRKNQQFFQLFWGSLKNGKIIKRYLTRKPWLFYRVESKLVLISKYNKTIDKVVRGKQINNHKWLSHMYRFFDSIIFKYIFSIKMMEAIPDQLESCRYDVCVQKQLKFGMIKGASLFTLSGHLKCNLNLQ
jgi:hypothetical protein